jgi:hypothetical protein
LFTQTTPYTYKFYILNATRKFFFHTYGSIQTEGVRTQVYEENIWTEEAGSEGWVETKFYEKLHDVSARRQMSKLCRTNITKERFMHFKCRIQAYDTACKTMI